MVRRTISTKVDKTKYTEVRLPKDISPSHYELVIATDFTTHTFDGSVKIYLDNSDVNKLVKFIHLHSNDLNITEGCLHPQDESQSISVLENIYTNPDNEVTSLEFNESVQNPKSLTLRFNAKLNDKMKGYYKTSFKIDKKTVWAGSTQFEATDARRAFPCWDEPDFKATFQVTLRYRKTFAIAPHVLLQRIALSNTRLVEQIEENDEVLDRFDVTPKMSTYLLAFVIGPFEYLEEKLGKRTIRVYTTPGKKAQGKFPLEVACRAITFYEKYFEIDYPLDKLDLIAIPDFSSGAMENWGLVTYRETCLLVDSEKTSTSRKQYIAIVVAHELAHQWFGNLVTMEWWTDLWLNEGFASFMEVFCVDHLFPEYDIWTQFLNDCQGPALELDALHNTHAIEVPVKHPSEIDEIFDEISYNKGGSVIRMLYDYIGDESFRKGLNHYLNKHKYSNASTSDLWASLEFISKKPVTKMMSGWTSRPGFPYIKASFLKKNNLTYLNLVQKKFTYDGQLSEGDTDVKWMVPVHTISGSSPSKKSPVAIFDGDHWLIQMNEERDNWIKVNPGSTGFFRVEYSPELLSKLMVPINDKTLPAADRLSIQSDYFALSQSGIVSATEYLKLLQSYIGETNFSVWLSIDSNISKLSVLFQNSDFLDEFKAFGRQLYSEIFKKVTWDKKSGENHTDSMLRPIIISRLISFNDQAVIEEALKKFHSQSSGHKPIVADLRAAVYKAVAVHGDDQLFNILFDIYRNDELHEEKNRALYSIGCAKDAQRLEKAIEFATSWEVKSQDMVFTVSSLGAHNPPVAWNMFKEHEELFRKKYGSTSLMARVVKSATVNLVTEEAAADLEGFFKEHNFPEADRTVKQSLEKIRHSVAWLNRDGDNVRKFLKNPASE